MSKDTGGPAFPVLHTIDGNWNRSPLAEYSGMTLRDYFAARAMQAFISARATLGEDDGESYSNASAIGIGCPNIWVEGAQISFCQDVASEAYFMADAMLAERDK